MAGDITTSGQFVTADGEYTYEDAFEMYKEQITILKNAGVDLIAAETMINIEETLAAVDAANSVCDLPVMCTVTVEADGSIFSGGNAVEAAVAFESAGAAAVGINCSVGPDQLVSVIRNIREAVSIPVIAKPNAGMPVIDDQGNAVYSMNPADFAKHMQVLVENGAGIIGGCCGTTPDFIREMKNFWDKFFSLYFYCLFRAHFLAAETPDTFFIIINRRMVFSVLNPLLFPVPDSCSHRFRSGCIWIPQYTAFSGKDSKPLPFFPRFHILLFFCLH